MSGAFGFNITDKFPGNLSGWQLKMGDECTVTIGSKTLITGYIDQININYNSANHSIQISGRDKTGDLTDCSFASTPNEWKNLTVSQIISNLCTPFGVEIAVDSSVTTEANTIIPTFKANEGETVSDLISNLCKKKAILPISLGDGKLTLTRAGTNSLADSLVLGENIKEGSLEQNNMDRFSIYHVKGQGAGGDTLSLGDFTQPSGSQEDEIINRYRPIVILSDQASNNAECRNFARWEARVRAGRSRLPSYIVQGWTMADGNPWPLNSLVEVVDDFIGISEKFIISDISFTLDQSGSETGLNLVKPETYDLIPEKIKKQNMGFAFDPSRLS
jgi:prophage tail gpP-like protein